MRSIDVAELKQTELEILDIVVKFCDEHGINYWLDGGTLLGAVRHKGFIPWDDDIDIGMLRPDYDKFSQLFNKENNTCYKFHSYDNDSEYPFIFGKVYDETTEYYEPDEKAHKLAINIDIWPYDNAPDDDRLVRKMFFLRRLYQTSAHRRVLPLSCPIPTRGGTLRRFLVYMLRVGLRVFPKFYFSKKAEENAKRYALCDTKRVGNFTGLIKAVCTKDVFNSFVDVDFENKKYKAPIGYDKWLRAFYGDYMQLPPIEERSTTYHKFKAYKEG